MQNIGSGDWRSHTKWMASSVITVMSLGAEYIWGRRADESGDDGTLNRLQFSAKYLY
jgi:hypothetical protein